MAKSNAPEPAVTVSVGPPIEPTPVADAPRRFRVTLGDASEVVEAANEAEAWAAFCDKRKSWPSPKIKGRSIEPVK